MKNISILQQFSKTLSAHSRIFTAPLSMHRPSTVQWSLYLILLLLLMGISLKNYHSIQVGITGDDAAYVVLARSIAWHDAYGLVNGPGAPQPTRFPFGFPLLLSPIARFLPGQADAMKYLSLLATLLNVSLLFWGWPLLSRNQSYWWSLLISSLYGFSQHTIELSRQVMSEPVFTSFALLTLIIVQYCLTRYSPHMPIRSKYLMLAGGLAFFTFSIRIIGLTLGVAVIVCIILSYGKSRIKALGVFVLGALLLMGIIALFTPIPLSSLLPYEYLSQFAHPQSYGQEHIESPFLIRLFSSFWEYMTYHLRIAVVTIGGGAGELNAGKHLGIPNLPAFSSFVVATVMIVGLVSSFFSAKLSLPVYAFTTVYFGAILLWPWREARFLHPIQPFLCYFFVQGLFWLSETLLALLSRRRNVLRAYGSYASVIAVSALILSIALYRGIGDTGTSFDIMPRDFRAGAEWLEAHSPGDATVMAQLPIAVHLYAKRPTVGYAYVSTATELHQTLRQQKVRYILVAPKKEWRTDGVLQYDSYTKENFLPFIHELEKQKFLERIHQEPEHLVEVYQVNL